ncbi:MAG: iron-containing redox enzyme family protein [Bdellovibrio sp.]|nr:iron-containing redox enzyme family protein [Bdellovibrio sp.]
MKLEQMQQMIQEEVTVLGNILKEAPWEDKNFYGMWLTQTYNLVRHTTKLLCLASARLPVENRDQHYVMNHHLHEELNHDLMALKDIQSLGFDTHTFPELPEAEAIHQLQYYWIDREHPLSLCGYAFMLEGAAKFWGPAILEKIEPKYGKNATVFLRVHAVVDQDHYEDSQKFLATLNDEERGYIAKNMKQSAWLYKGMVERIKQECAALKKPNAKAA